MNLDDEPSLINASRRGDADAFSSLILRYQRMIHALTFRMSGSEADAADLAQEAFLQAWRRLDGFRGEARFSSWLYRIAMNICLNWKAGTAREARARTDWGETTLATAPASEDRRAALVRESLLKLPAKQRAAIVLTLYEGMNHGEAARVLGCREATVSWRVFAARAKLKRWLTSAGRQEAGR